MRLSSLAASIFSVGLAVAAVAGCSESTDPPASNGGSGAGGKGGSGSGGSGSGGSSSGGSGGSSSGGSGGSGSGGSGSGGSGSGGSGSGGSPGGGDAGGAVFTKVEPCAMESDYMEATTITFPGTGGLSYAPKCLKVKVGADVKFMGNFTVHPLAPSAKRGDQTGNPVKETTTGTEATFKFDKAGTFGYWCKFHGDQDSGKFMAGVVWVVP